MFGAVLKHLLNGVAVVGLCLYSTLVNAQVPSWADGKDFNLADVEMSLTRPSGGFREMSADGKVVDDSGFFQGYTATIHGDGRVVVNLDTESGSAPHLVRADLPRDTIYSLLEKFVQIQFFDLPTLYNGGATLSPWASHALHPPPAKFRIGIHHTVLDGSYLKLRLKIAEHVKSITDWNGEGPHALDEIAKAIEDVAGLSKASK